MELFLTAATWPSKNAAFTCPEWRGMARNGTSVAPGIIRHITRHPEIGAARALNLRPVVRVRLTGIGHARRIREHNGLTWLAHRVFPGSAVNRTRKTGQRIDAAIFRVIHAQIGRAS